MLVNFNLSYTSAQVLLTPTGYHFEPDFLHRLSVTCQARIIQQYEFYKNVSKGNQVQVTFGVPLVRF